MSFITDMDLYILDRIQESLRTPVLDRIMVFVSSLGNSGFIWILASIVFVIIKKYRKCGVSMMLALIFCLMIGNVILKPYFARIRPFDVNTAVELIMNRPQDYSFPSGHTMAAFACFFAVIFYNKTIGIPMLVLSVLMAFSRLYLYMHYPTDVLGGMFLGCIFGLAAAFITSKIFRREKEKKSG